MKILLFLLLPFACLSQNKGYISFRGGVAFKEQTRALGFISGGIIQKKTLGLGIGLGYIKFDKQYLPLTADFTFFGIPKKLSPMFLGQIGYGFYNSPNDETTIKGGLTGSLNGGVSFPVKESRLFLLGGVQTFQFRSTKGNIASQGSSYAGSSFTTMFAVTTGFKL